MTKRIFAFLLLAVLACSLVACSAAEPKEELPPDTFDPSLVYFEKQVIADASLNISATLKNDSASSVSVGGTFTLSRGDVLRSGTLRSITVAPGSAAEIPFDFSALNLTEGSFTVTVTYTRVDNSGILKTGEATFLYSYNAAENTDAKTETQTDPASTDVSSEEITDTPTENRDVMTTPIAYMTDSEAEELAKYLFEHYVPCCFGIFESPADLSSSSLWISVATLNSVVDEDTSDESRTLEAAQKKVALYYPGSNFKAEEVRLFDKSTQTFRPSPTQVQKYTYLSYEKKGDAITVFYQDIPEDTETEPSQYATTLKKSSESGYFAFVSTRRVGAVG